MRRIYLVVLVLSFGFCTYGATYEVGSTRAYKSPNELYLADVLTDGDIIEVDAETYVGTASLAVWQNNDLIIKSIGGNAILNADGEYIWGKGIWVLAGNNITVDGFEFYGASVPDQNGAGIRLDGSGLTVRHCYFHDNDNGILTNNTYEGEILIEYSEFGYNGFGDGQSHNLYIGHCDKFTFQFNYSHHASIGHNFKSRAAENVILYNRIMDEETGNSSRLIDIPNGGLALIMGNLFMQGNNAPNKNMIGYGLEGLESENPHELYLVHNTFVNKRASGCLFVHVLDNTSKVHYVGNIFAGSGELQDGIAVFVGNESNLMEPEISNIGFVDEENYDYRLTADSQVIDLGVGSMIQGHYDFTPSHIYRHPLSSGDRVLIGTQFDLGAYEYISPSSNINTEDADVLIFPNPAEDMLQVSIDRGQIDKIKLFTPAGKLVKYSRFNNSINLDGLPSGIYLVRINMNGGQVIKRHVIKR